MMGTWRYDGDMDIIWEYGGMVVMEIWRYGCHGETVIMEVMLA
jgi:hypothetical protein